MFGAHSLYQESHERFKVLSKQDPFELRSYQKLLYAKVSVRGNFHEIKKTALNHLRQYLGGHNFKVSVIKNYGPFYQTLKSDFWEMGVILPPDFSILTAPRPINAIIQLAEVPPTTCGVLSFKGTVTPEIVLEKAAYLKRWLWRNRWQISGPVRVECHDLNPGFSFLKHSEVLIDVG